MGLQSDIEYELRHANAFQRSVQRFGETTLGTALLSRVLRTLDLLLHRLSGGRKTFAGVFGGFPIILLTTTGARSRLARTNPLTGIPLGDDLAVVGANYGLGVVPSWVYNLRTNSEAEVAYGSRTVRVRAREVSGDEAERVFAAACRIFPGYAEYRQRFREPVPAFVLEPRPDQ